MNSKLALASNMNIHNTLIHNVFFRCFVNLLTAYLQSHRNILAITNYRTEITMIIMILISKIKILRNTYIYTHIL